MKKIGDYTVKRKIDEGGNGIVFEVCRCENEYALKKLKKKDLYSFKRFKDEIGILLREKDNDGILPLFDYNLTGPLP